MNPIETATMAALTARDAAEEWYRKAREANRTLKTIIDQARQGATRGELACMAARHLGWDGATVFALAEELTDRSSPFKIDATTYREFAVDPSCVGPVIDMAPPPTDADIAKARELGAARWIAVTDPRLLPPSASPIFAALASISRLPVDATADTDELPRVEGDR